MSDDALNPTQKRERWWDMLLELGPRRDPLIIAETYRLGWNSYSTPVALQCNDGNEYVVKGQQAGRPIVTDHIIAHLGVALGAPVGEPHIISIPSELRDIEPQLANITPGTAHGTLFIQNCSDRAWLAHTDVPENRNRFALLAVLYGWCYASDHQVIYSNDTPSLVYSVDHGHFLPGGTGWTVDTLLHAPPAHLYQDIVQGCQLTIPEQQSALRSLYLVQEEVIVRAIAAPPAEWGVTMEERIALIVFFVQRREQLLTHLIPLA